MLVFFVSAVFHEVAVGVPLHMLRLTAFTGIMLQVRFVWHSLLEPRIGSHPKHKGP